MTAKSRRWLVTNVVTRLNPATGRLLVIQTRWHRDDLIGRLGERFPDIVIRRYPAIADEAFVAEHPQATLGSVLTKRFTAPKSISGDELQGVDPRQAIDMRRREMGSVDFAAQY